MNYRLKNKFCLFFVDKEKKPFNFSFKSCSFFYEHFLVKEVYVA
ncbi:hypothetical protein HMPREF9505_00689 [Enterococcus faecalis TX0109]|nr:hypothetical protein HMPREF9505_00689 [Enterococcus faecalis TX0109]EFU09743.1 hypothetical protein HMPREF9516_00646 [Enterococcus faecalis TX1302]